MARPCSFDHPDAFDREAVRQCLLDLKSMRQVEVPEYDFTTHQRSASTRRVPPADVVIVEGILVLHMEEIRDMLNMKIYVDTDDDVRLARRCGVRGSWCPAGGRSLLGAIHALVPWPQQATVSVLSA